MELRFDKSEIPDLAAKYDIQNKNEKNRTEEITRDIFPAYKRNGFLTKEHFVAVCEWKTPRTKPRCESNDEGLIREVSEIARKTRSEQLRIQIWTLLTGVSWPTASVFLHFAYPDHYPILDFRALESLKTKVPAQYTFPFWKEYADFCRNLSREADVDMRTLDKALWMHSFLHPKK